MYSHSDVPGRGSLPFLVIRSLVRSVVGAGDIVELALRRTSRRVGFVLGRTAYAALMLGIIALVLANETDASDLPNYGYYIFAVIASLQLAVAFFAPPVLLAHAVAQERRQGTVGMLMVTHTRPELVVRGLVTSRLLVLLAIFLGGAPVASIAGLLGGVSFEEIAYLVLASLMIAFLGASLGAYLGADLPPRYAALLSFFVTLVLIWLMQYPLMILMFAGAALVSGAGMPKWLLAFTFVCVLTPFFLFIHRFFTRQAARALIRRQGESYAPVPPAPRKTPQTGSPATAPEAVRPAPRRPGPQRDQSLARLLSPRLSQLPIIYLIGAMAVAAAAATFTFALPEEPVVLSVIRVLLRVMLAAAATSLLVATLLAASFYPAVRISAFRSDATLVLVALTPINLGRTFRKLELRALAVLLSALVVAWLLLAPAPEKPELAWFAGLLTSFLPSAAFTLLLGSFAFWVGTLVRSTGRAIGVMVVLWVILLASLLFSAIFELALHHPLGVPFGVFSEKMSPEYVLGYTALTALFSLAFHFVSRRRMMRIWREPFESITRAGPVFET